MYNLGAPFGAYQGRQTESLDLDGLFHSFTQSELQANGMRRWTYLALATLGTVTLAFGCKQASSEAQFVTSNDGTKIAYDQVGTGPALVIVGGMLSDRAGAKGLATALSSDFSVYTFDRRGRGESGDTMPYSVAREIEDIANIRKVAGGDIALYGHSSGAGLALAAVAAGLPVRALVLHEPPFGAVDEPSRRRSAEEAAKVRKFIAEDRRSEAIQSFLTYAKVPPEMVKQAASDPAMLRKAPSMIHDLDIMESDSGSLLPEDRVGAIKVKTVVLVGSKAPPPFHEAGMRIARIVPDGEFLILEGQEHNADPAVVAAAIRKALQSSDR
jgi:pimeloyl-ACP methyl ester carboxylesterase